MYKHLHFHEQKIIGLYIAMDDFGGMQMMNDVQYLTGEMHHQTFVHHLE